MKILVDADACPVVAIVEQTARKHKIPVVLLCDTNHVLHSDYSEVIIVDAGADAVDFALVGQCREGDIVVTQDYGVAAMILGKGAYGIHQSGKWYTDENIDRMLMERHVAKQARRGSGRHHIKGPSKRTREDDEHFAASLERLVIRCCEKRNIRLAHMEDLAAIAALEAACFPPAEAAGEESFRGRLAVFPQHFWLLFEEGKLVAMINGMVTDTPKLSDEMFVDAAMHDEAGAWQMIFGVETAPEYRGLGFAALLMRRVIADARAQRRRGLVLTCKEQLLPYYARFGFVNEGVSASVHGGAVWYDMRLTFEKEH